MEMGVGLGSHPNSKQATLHTDGRGEGQQQHKPKISISMIITLKGLTQKVLKPSHNSGQSCGEISATVITLEANSLQGPDFNQMN